MTARPLLWCAALIAAGAALWLAADFVADFGDPSDWCDL